MLGTNTEVRQAQGYRPGDAEERSKLSWATYRERVQGEPWQFSETLFQGVKGEAGQMTQKLRAPVALLEDPSLVPSSHIGWLSTNSICRVI